MSPEDDPKMQGQLAEIGKAIDLKEYLASMGEGYEPLSIDDALKHIEKIESYKVELLAGVIVASRIGQFPED